MKKPMGKRFLSGVTSGLLAVTYALPSGLSPLQAAADSVHPADGLPVLDRYEDTQWYMNNPLGVAGDFHLFGFEEVITRNHVNGNIATPNLVVEKGSGASPNKPSGDVVKMLNVITKSITWGEEADHGKDWQSGKEYCSMNMNNMNDAMLPKDYEIWANDTVDYSTNPPSTNKRTQLSYPTKLTGWSSANVFFGTKDQYENGEKDTFLRISSQLGTSGYIGHAGDKFIDFEALKKEYKIKSDDFAQLSERYADFVWDAGDPWDEPDPLLDPERTSTLTLAKEGANVLSINASDAEKYNNVTVKDINLVGGERTAEGLIGGVYEGEQTLIVNINLEQAESFTWNPTWHYYSVDGEDLNGAEETCYVGTNIILNFYNAKEGGTEVYFGGSAPIPMGVALAPDCDFKVGQINGAVIANKIDATNETHAAYFKNPLSTKKTISVSAEKSWSDGDEKHSGDEVHISLYRAGKGGLKNVLDEFSVANKFDDAVRAVSLATGMSAYREGAGGPGAGGPGASKTLSADTDAKNISIVTGGAPGAEPSTEVVFKKSGDEVTSTLEDGTYTYTRRSGMSSTDLTFTVAGGKVTEISGEAISAKKIGEAKTLKEANSWKETWTDLAKTDIDGNNYYYYVVEENVPKGYTVSYEGNGVTAGNKKITVANTGEGIISKIKIAKLSDTLTVENETDSDVSFTSAEERISGAQLTLKLKAAAEEGSKLDSGVKSSLDDSVNGKPVYSEDTITWTTVGLDIEFEGLPDGLYELTEIAPIGYQPIKPMEFRIDNGKVNGKEEQIVLTDEVFVVMENKTNAEGTSVAGALLRLTSTSGADLSTVKAHSSAYFTADGKAYSTDANGQQAYRLDNSHNEIRNLASDRSAAFEWYSTGSDVVFTGLPEGDYSIVEVSAPAGYAADKKARNFSVSRDSEGKLTAIGDISAASAQKLADIVNKKQTVTISKGDMGAKIIEGAEFELTAKDGAALGNITVPAPELAETVKKSIGTTLDSKGVKITGLEDGKEFRIIGPTFNNVKVNDADASSGQNVYEYTGKVVDGSIKLDGLRDGTYTVT
ncbi:SpaA isopeptide-forming pilin-related protein, partial [Ruminococcus flavefaciens]|uniref:SpaA isopeptide-forming pilin-related protein n=1 Tax=Ruminococcus flavefaciens TaxID=1265 RepID=UPI00159E7DA2